MRRKRIFLFILVGGCLFLACSFLLFFQSKDHSQLHFMNAEPEVCVVKLNTERVKIITELAGRTSSYITAEIRPQVGGIIKKQFFCEGFYVQAGEILYQINPISYRTILKSAKANLAKSEAVLFATRLKAKRYENLLAVNAISQQTYDEIYAIFKQAEAEAAISRAALEIARINLNYTQVTAPISGCIGRSMVSPGALVTANQVVSLATIQQLDPIYVDLTQSSSEFLRFKRALASGAIKKTNTGNHKIRLILEDGSIYPLDGILQFSEVNVDQDTGTITMRAIFLNPKHELLPGMYVRANLEIGIDDHALLVPQQAVSRNNRGEATVFVLDAQNCVQFRIIEIDRIIGNKWLVNSGLKAGERVIVEGLQKIYPGVTAKVVSEILVSSDVEKE